MGRGEEDRLSPAEKEGSPARRPPIGPPNPPSPPPGPAPHHGSVLEELAGQRGEQTPLSGRGLPHQTRGGVPSVRLSCGEGWGGGRGGAAGGRGQRGWRVLGGAPWSRGGEVGGPRGAGGAGRAGASVPPGMRSRCAPARGGQGDTACARGQGAQSPRPAGTPHRSVLFVRAAWGKLRGRGCIFVEVAFVLPLSLSLCWYFLFFEPLTAIFN